MLFQRYSRTPNEGTVLQFLVLDFGPIPVSYLIHHSSLKLESTIFLNSSKYIPNCNQSSCYLSVAIYFKTNIAGLPVYDFLFIVLVE